MRDDDTHGAQAPPLRRWPDVTIFVGHIENTMPLRHAAAIIDITPRHIYYLRHQYFFRLYTDAARYAHHAIITIDARRLSLPFSLYYAT